MVRVAFFEKRRNHILHHQEAHDGSFAVCLLVEAHSYVVLAAGTTLQIFEIIWGLTSAVLL